MGHRLTLTADDGHSLGAYRADVNGAARSGMIKSRHAPGRWW